MRVLHLLSFILLSILFSVYRAQEPVSDLPQDAEDAADPGRPSQLLHASGEGDLDGIQVRHGRKQNTLRKT